MRCPWSLGALFLLLGSAGAPASAEMPQPMIGEQAPLFRLPSLAGETLDLADLRGRTVVLHFGAGW